MTRVRVYAAHVLLNCEEKKYFAWFKIYHGYLTVLFFFAFCMDITEVAVGVTETVQLYYYKISFQTLLSIPNFHAAKAQEKSL